MKCPENVLKSTLRHISSIFNEYLEKELKKIILGGNNLT
jgi:peptide subunit release factor 1 (eRF1)